MLCEAFKGPNGLEEELGRFCGGSVLGLRLDGSFLKQSSHTNIVTDIFHLQQFRMNYELVMIL